MELNKHSGSLRSFVVVCRPLLHACQQGGNDPEPKATAAQRPSGAVAGRGAGFRFCSCASGSSANNFSRASTRSALGQRGNTSSGAPTILPLARSERSLRGLRRITSPGPSCQAEPHQDCAGREYGADDAGEECGTGTARAVTSSCHPYCREARCRPVCSRTQLLARAIPDQGEYMLPRPPTRSSLARIFHEWPRIIRKRLTILRRGRFRQSWATLVRPDRRFYANCYKFNVFRGST